MVCPTSHKITNKENIIMATKAKKTVPAKKAASKSKAKTAPATKAKTKSAPAKKATSTKAKTTTKAKTAAKPKGKQKITNGQSLPRDLNEHGFVKGSQSEKIVECLLEGGKDRREVNEKIRKALKGPTRNGTEHNVSSLSANLLKRLRDKGYTIESSWRLVEPTPASKAAATRRAKKSTGTAEAAPSKAKRTAKKVPAKRAKK
jgi:hypothetical protein